MTPMDDPRQACECIKLSRVPTRLVHRPRLTNRTTHVGWRADRRRRRASETRLRTSDGSYSSRNRAPGSSKGRHQLSPARRAPYRARECGRASAVAARVERKIDSHHALREPAQAPAASRRRRATRPSERGQRHTVSPFAIPPLVALEFSRMKFAMIPRLWRGVASTRNHRSSSISSSIRTVHSSYN